MERCSDTLLNGHCRVKSDLKKIKQDGSPKDVVFGRLYQSFLMLQQRNLIVLGGI